MPRQKNTDVWENYFHSATSKVVKCKHCEKVYQFGNVSKMSSHLLKCYKCPTVIKYKLQKIPVTGTTTTNMPLQDESHEMAQDNSLTSTTCNITSSDISTEKKLHLDQLLSKAIFVTGCPLFIVEHPLWVQFFEELQTPYKLPSREAISSIPLETTYKEMVDEVKEELKSLNDLHLQCDGYSNQRNECIIDFIIAKPEPVFVNTLTNTTSQYLSEEIIKVIDEYGGNKFATLIGDNANNIQRAFQIVRDSYAHIIPLRCVAHTLGLLCEDCLKPIHEFIPIAANTIKAIKRNQRLSALLPQITKEKGSSETLKLPEKTDWGSYCTALKSLLKYKVSLQTLAFYKEANISDETITNLLDLNFWTMVENYIKLLEPITDIFFKLEGNGMHINEVYMAFKEIEWTFNFKFPDISILNEHDKQNITNAVNRRLNDCLKPIHYAAYLLDPRSQGIGLEKAHEVDAMEFIHNVSRSLDIDVGVDLANYRAKQGLWSRSFIWKHADEMDPMVWWRGICRSKSLSRVAVRILTAPCTSATERSFSTLAHIDHKRNGLTTDRAAKIAFISYNWNQLHKHKDDDNDDEPLSTPRELSSLGTPLNVELPSISCGNPQEIDLATLCSVRSATRTHSPNMYLYTGCPGGK